MKKVVIVDYGMGNLHSVLKGMQKVNVPVKISSDAKAIKDSCAIVLPGVGAFGDAMREIRKRGLLKVIKDEVKKGKPILGICLGMQLLISESPEHGKHKGFGFIPGRAVKFKGDIKIPHMGWNKIIKQKDKKPILKGIKDDSFAYFVHSYYVKPTQDKYVLTKTKYGKTNFASAIIKDNIFGFQFHPEKSSEKMLKIYKNFYDISQKNMER